jgi:hypothetical protein
LTHCDTYCADTSSDLNNCGTCGHACPATPANATAVCSNGHCGFTCNDGYADCDGIANNGCETNITNDPNNCGRCGNICFGKLGEASSVFCSDRNCNVTCVDQGLTGCNSVCVNLNTDPEHCGACNVSCTALLGLPPPNSHWVCTYPVLTVLLDEGISVPCDLACDEHFADCNVDLFVSYRRYSDGCETHIYNNRAACGSCHNACDACYECVGDICVFDTSISTCTGYSFP